MVCPKFATGECRDMQGGCGCRHVPGRLFKRELLPATLEISADKQKAFMGVEFTAEEARRPVRLA